MKDKKAKHRSVDKSLKKQIAWLQSLDIVTKIILGLAECCRHAFPPGHLKYQGETEAGIRLNGYGGKGIIKIFVCTEEKKILIDLIEERMR